MFKTLKFGNGDLLVGTTFNALIIRKLKLSKTIGQLLNPSLILDIEYTITIPLTSIADADTLKTLVKNSFNQPVFEFQDFIFNFENYDRKSVDALLD
jgi:hypothetical protein